MKFKSGEVHGIVANVKPGAEFRFLRSNEGDIFVSPSLVRNRESQFVAGALVRVVYESADRGLKATKIMSIEPPPPPLLDPNLSIDYFGTLRFFNPEKRYGFVECEAIGRDVFLPARVATEGGIGLESGTRLGFRVGRGKDGRLVVEKAWETVTEVVPHLSIQEVASASEPTEELPSAPALDVPASAKKRTKRTMVLPPSLQANGHGAAVSH